MLKRLERELAPCSLADVAIARLPCSKEFCIVGRVGEDRYALVVLRRGAEEGNTANVDLLDCVGERAPRLGDRVREWVEVADDDGDGGDLLGLKVGLIGRYGPRKDTWTRGLHARLPRIGFN